MQLKARVTAVRSGYIYPDKKPRIMLTFENAEYCNESIIIRRPDNEFGELLGLDDEYIFELKEEDKSCQY